jgi:diguanylate cyclase (GGDEF)-like protein
MTLDSTPLPQRPDGDDVRPMPVGGPIDPGVPAGGLSGADDPLHARFTSLANNIPGVVVYQRKVWPDGAIKYTYISDGVRDLFGVEPEEVLANPYALFNLHGPDYHATFRERLLNASRELKLWDVEATIIAKDGRRKFTHAIARPHREPNGCVVWDGVIIDSTRIKEAEIAAAAAEANTRTAIIENLSQGLLLFDPEDRLITANSNYFEIYPALTGVAAEGARYAAIVSAEFRCAMDADLEAESLDNRVQEHLAAHADAVLVTERRLGDGRWILVHEHRTPEGGSVALYTDVTELKRREEQIQHMAHHDALTGLPNRVLFRDRLSQALARSRRQGGGIGVLCLDLDHFKDVNDILGHPAGDTLLKQVAGRLAAIVRETDTVARLGGDEFAIIQLDVENPEAASKLCRRILTALEAPFDLDGHQAATGTSIGIAISAVDGEDPDRLLKSADMALYRAKADGRGTFRFFQAEMDAKVQARRSLEFELRNAITTKELELFYQPILDVSENRIAGLEALMRWRHPVRGMVSPAEFIPLAEETGLIVPMGEWALRTACKQVAAWSDTLKIAVNLSPVQFKDRNLEQVIRSALQDSALAPNRLELEITETVLLKDGDATLQTLHSLRDLGVRISMDDFGTGYSSLSYLRSFPFDKIKIDRSFVMDLKQKEEGAAIVKAMVGLGSSLGMTTTAEGVETAEQLEFLRNEGCSEVQGFFFSKPRPASEIPEILSAQSNRSRPE